MGWLLLVPPSPVAAHDLEFTYTIILLRPDGSFQVDVTCDLDALALGVALGVDAEQVVRGLRRLSSAELEARIRRVGEILEERVELRFDGVLTRGRLSFPDYQKVQRERPPIPTILGLTARFTGSIPPGARSLTFGLDRMFPPVYLTAIDERTEYLSQQILPRGVTSDPFPVGREGLSPAPAPNRWHLAARTLWLGITHIVPEGLDHMLFVLGLFLLTVELRPLLWQVTAFTAAHTVTLALSSYGILRLSPTIVEPLIALSIAYVAIENLFTQRLTRWRPLVVFLFGLLHGLGFAGVLGKLGLPENDFFLGLVSFNLGVELGQMAVLSGAFLTIGWLRNRPWYRKGVTLPLSTVIALVGIYWALTRTFWA